ncbi:hypothetical protein BH09ACT8_BH09ACT8_42560 [soil metagenome]
MLTAGPGSELELAAAVDFLDLVPGADMVKFAKNGADATTAAIKLARAATGRLRVAICEQPFFSTDDWFIGTTPMNGGIGERHRRPIARCSCRKCCDVVSSASPSSRPRHTPMPIST